MSQNVVQIVCFTFVGTEPKTHVGLKTQENNVQNISPSFGCCRTIYTCKFFICLNANLSFSRVLHSSWFVFCNCTDVQFGSSLPNVQTYSLADRCQMYTRRIWRLFDKCTDVEFGGFLYHILNEIKFVTKQDPST